jgi:PAS domain S-box-containing protein
MTQRRPPQHDTPADWTWIGPVVVTVAVFAVALLLLLAERQAARDEIRAEVEVTAEQVAARLSVWISDRTRTLGQFATLLGRGVLDDDEFRTQARIYVERVPGFLAVNWIDAEGVIRIVEPRARNRAAEGQDLRRNPEPAVRDAIDRALEDLRPVRTPYIPLYQGGRGFSVYWPVDRPGPHFGSVVNGVITLDAIIANALPDVRFNARYLVTLADADGTPIFATGDDGGPGRDFRVGSRIDFVDHALEVAVQPRAAPAATFLGSSFVALVLAAAAFSVILGLLLRGYLQRQRAVLRQEAYTRLLMDSASEGLLGVDLDGACTFCNIAGARLLGHARPEDLVGRPALGWILDDPEDASTAPPQALLAAVRAGEPWHADVARARARDGHLFQVECRAHPVIEDGRLQGSLITFTDVTTERAEAEHARRLTTVLHEVPELVGLTDTRGDITFLNPAGRVMTGIGERDPGAFNILAFIDGPTLERLQSEIVERVTAGEHWRGEVTLVDWDGEPVPAAVVVMRHRDPLGTVYFSAVARDLRENLAAERERRTLEEQFREAQRLESLGLLAGSIAHDFNNMLVGILGNASLALETLEDGHAARGPVSQVQTATEHAARLTGQLLAYSGRGRFEAEALDLGALVREMSDLLRTSVPRHVDLDVDCPDGHGVVADATQLRQLVMNLITNAADAIGERGRVSVRVRTTETGPEDLEGHVWEAPEARARYVLLEVEDDGAGMSEAVVEHIFDPFFTTKATGKGLGLAAVRGIVRGHAGFMTLRSRPDEGTRFRVYLPPAAAPPARTADEVGPEASPLSGTVLLVDDEPTVRRYLETALRTMGFEVIACEDGHAGLEAFSERHHELALVLMDQTMPGMSGDAAWARMHAIDPDVPGILISGYDEVRIEGSLRDKGLSGFIQKPFRFQDLREAVTTATAPAPGSEGVIG